jgi:hypothetical protein
MSRALDLAQRCGLIDSTTPKRSGQAPDSGWLSCPGKATFRLGRFSGAGQGDAIRDSMQLQESSNMLPTGVRRLVARP